MRRQIPLHLRRDHLADHIKLQIHLRSSQTRGERGALQGFRNQRHFKPIRADLGHRKTDSIHRDTAASDKMLHALRRHLHAGSPGAMIAIDIDHLRDGVDVALHHMPAQQRVGAKRAFKIHAIADAEQTHRGQRE